MEANEITRVIVDAAYQIHTRLGPGLLESAYLALMKYELQKRNLDVQIEVPMPLLYDGLTLDVGYRADMLVEDQVIVELKSLEQIAPVHKKQLLTYLRVADKRVGLLLNFGAPMIRDGITWVVNRL